jgi:hypothetical protein
MARVWYQHNQGAVEQALARREPIDMATTMASGPLDELVALHEELGIFAALEALRPERQRRGLDDGLLLRTVAVLPFLPPPSLDGAATQLFGEPAILLHLGWSPLQIRIGDNERHRSPDGRQPESLPCHPETLRDAVARVTDAAWRQAQRAGVQALYERGLVRGRTYAVDGTGLGPQLRLVCLVCVSARRPVIVAWRLLAGDASEKGKEAAVTRSLIEQALELGGRGAIGLLLADALYADGPLLAWCKYVQGIDVLVPVPTDRDLHRDLEGLAAGGLLKFQRYRYVRRIQGHKQRRTLDLGAARGLTSWESFVQAARQYGAEGPTLWACLIRPVEPTDPEDRPWTLVSTRDWDDPTDAFREFRGRWHVENDAYRELKEGWGLEAERWSRQLVVQHGRVALTCLAFNTAQVYLSRLGKRSAVQGIRRLRRRYRRHLGACPAVIYIGHNFAVMPVERLVRLLGVPTRQSLLPPLRVARPP